MEVLDVNKQMEILNDLIQVNNDRIAGYEKAIEGLGEEGNDDLKGFFRRMANNSVDYNETLERQIGLLEGEPALGTSGAGKLYRAWMDFKALVTGGERAAILNSCITGEETAIRAYEDAIAEASPAPPLQELLGAQLAEIIQSHREVKAMAEISNTI